METILVATDFSAAARNAVDYGSSLAQSLGAKLVLANVYPVTIQSADSVVLVTQDELKENAEMLLEEEESRINPDGSLHTNTWVSEGGGSPAIIAAAKEMKADWIIVGMKGSSNIFRQIFGSTAFSISRHSPVPVIIVPEKATFTEPKTIALASDINEVTNVAVINPLARLCEHFDSDLHVVRVVKNPTDALAGTLSTIDRIKLHNERLHTDFETVSDADVTHAMEKFVTDKKVDMVTMIAQEHNLLERIFVKSNIKEMMMYTHVPLMVLPGKV